MRLIRICQGRSITYSARRSYRSPPAGGRRGSSSLIIAIISGMIKKLLLVLTLLVMYAPIVHAQNTSHSQGFQKAKVISIEKEGLREIGGRKNPFQQLTLQLLDGGNSGSKITLEHGGSVVIASSQKVRVGETLIVTKITQGNKSTYSVIDRYRLPSLLTITLIFFLIITLLTGKKGLGSIAGLLVSLLIIVLFIVPQILSGNDPLIISIIGSLAIMLITLYLAHGFNSRTTIAVVATFVSLVLTGIIAVIAVNMSKLSGLGSEDAYNLLISTGRTINVQGLLLGGIIIGSLGVLDDTTTTQSTTVAELSRANPNYSMKQLFTSGMVIGKEHIASLVNTLVLAYAGAAIGIFIFIIISLQTHSQPWWVIFNSEIIAEEIVRTLAGSMGLVLAVPITTILAAFFAKNEIKIN